MDAEQTFLANLPLIERVIAFVCRRHHVYGADADDFASSVKLKLIERDYAILRQFEGRSSLATFLTVVVTRLHRDQQVHIHGKWRPSVAAKREGEHAELLEALLTRDHLPFEDACRVVQQRHPEVSRAELERLHRILPQRAIRASDEDALEAVEHLAAAGGPSAESQLIERESQEGRRRAAACLHEALGRLDEEERLLLKLRFFDGLKVSTISRILGADQKRLYKQLDRIAAGLRNSLTARGFDAAAVRELLAGGDEGLELPVPSNTDVGISRIGPSTEMEHVK